MSSSDTYMVGDDQVIYIYPQNKIETVTRNMLMLAIRQQGLCGHVG